MLIDWLLRKNIRFNLFIMFMLLSVVPLLFSIVQNYFIQKSNLEAECQARLEGIAGERARLIDDWFEDNIYRIRSFSYNPLVNTGDPEKIGSLISSIQKANPDSKAVFLLSIQGDVVSSTNKSFKGNFSDEPYFKKAVTGIPVAGNVIRNFKQSSIVFAAPVYNSRKIVGVLAQSVDITELHKIVDVSGEGKTLEGFLISSITGDYVVPPNRLTGTAQAEIQSYLKNQMFDVVDQGDFRIAGNNAKLLLAHKFLNSGDMALVIKQDEQEAIKMAKGKGLRNSIAITLLLMIVLTFAVTWLTKTIALPLEQISSTLREMAAGNYKQHLQAPVANQEIRVVFEDINTLSEELLKAKSTIAAQILMLEEKHKAMTAAHRELLDSNARLENVANRDQLTGIYNRRYLQNKLQAEIAYSLSSGSDLSFIMFDIDYFKRINDSYGHQVGDQVLVELAALVQKIIRRTDILARFGGEEFVILALNTSIDEGFNIAEKVRRAIEQVALETDAGKIKVTVSVGISALDKCREKDNANDISDFLFKDADKNLYEAKASGRNKVVA